MNISRRKLLNKVPVTMLGGILGFQLFNSEKSNARSIAPGFQVDKNTGVYNIRDFNAKGDGKTLDTKAVQAAIDTCSKNGGGTVFVPPGVFVIGTVELKSDITLYLSSGSTIMGTTDGKEYHEVNAIPLKGDTTLNDGNWALLYAVNARNISIEGHGTIDGQGAAFKKRADGSIAPNLLVDESRPYHFLAYKCLGINVRDISLVNCAYHSIRIIQSERINLNSIYINNRVNVNNDGFHFISCKNVSISDCTLICQDDACAFFGSCEGLNITNSKFSTRWSVFRFGGGKVKNIVVNNCIFFQVYGCPIKFQGSPGSSLENASFSNLIFEEVTGPIYIECGYSEKSPSYNLEPAAYHPNGKASVIVRNVSFDQISGSIAASPGKLPGWESNIRTYPGEPLSCVTISSSDNALIENVSFTNIRLTFFGGGTVVDAARRKLPQSSGGYFTMGPMPAYGFYIRSVYGLTMHNITLNVQNEDLRPGVILDGVNNAMIDNLAIQAFPKALAAICTLRSEDILLRSPRLLTQTQVFLRVEGSENKDILIDGGKISKALKTVVDDSGTIPSTVRLR